MSAGDRDPQYPRQYQCFEADSDWSRANDVRIWEAWHRDHAAEQYAEQLYSDGNSEAFPLSVVVRDVSTGEETRHVVELEWEPSFLSSPE